MTPKELLYLEDSLGMEQQLHIKCTDYSGKIQNPGLKNICSQMAQQHKTHFDNLMSHLHS
ncbi:MAG: ferritin-like domain-containing protein [Oscillospiraceae bacterium]|nr:ferritin-like domain-containing protein [Oscillospiraceae bacterium]